VRLLSWNIKCAESSASEPPPDVDAIAAVIASQYPDIVCLQEVALGPNDDAAVFLKLVELLGMDGRLQVGSRSESRATAVLWRPEQIALRGQTTHYADLFYHSAAIVDLDVSALPQPLKVASVHLHPHSVDARPIEASVFHMKGAGTQLTVLAGDFNCLGARDPEPDWSLTKPGNRAARTVPAPPGAPPLGDRRVGWALARAGYTDACAGPEFIKTAGYIRVDQAHVSEALAPALTGYRVLDDGGLSDHRPIIVSLDASIVTGGK
jgi:endonuclease/exonuclease/phosphatase family metal-dependent hydrolase